MRIIRYQLKLRVYTRGLMLINSTVFAVERLTKFITNRRFSFASLFLRASLALRNICPAVTTLPELNKESLPDEDGIFIFSPYTCI